MRRNESLPVTSSAQRPSSMPFLRRCFLFAVVALVLAARVLAQAGARDTAEAKSALDRDLRAAVERKDVPGIVVIAADRRGVLHEAAFGAAEGGTGRAMTTDAIFRIASMTKAVTSVALMQLIEQGKLSLEDDAGKHLPELANPQLFESFNAETGEYTLRPAKSSITVRHLLTHTSGLGYPFTSATLARFRPRAGESYPAGPLLFEPGTDWIYGTSTDMVGKLVEKVSGQDLEAYFQEKILRPLKMSDTSYNVAPGKYARLVNNWSRNAAGALVEGARGTPRTATRFSGGGGLHSTARDYVRFLQMLLNRGELDGARILAPATVALMEQNHIGHVGVRAVKSTSPNLSADFNFVDDGKDKWGLAGQITTAGVAGKRSPGSVSWGGINNTFFWYDPTRGVAGVIMMQFLPFADAKALAVYDTFERGVYRLVE